MKLTEVIESAREVRAVAEEEGDFEKAHMLEDALHMRVLVAIANGGHSKSMCEKLAYEATRTALIDFPRPCS